MRNISAKQNTIGNTSVFLCKNVDYQNLGREIYADNVETPVSFYLIRELKLARDYQNLAEGEAYFDAICDSWDDIDDFDDLVVKKIYVYVETEVMYYSLYIGSFKPTRSDLRFRLKEWLASIKVEKQNRSLIQKNSAIDVPEMQNVMKQLLETSNEIFRLKRTINELNITLENERMEKKLANIPENTVVSRSIRTIHLKRAQPLIVDEENFLQNDYDTSIYSETEKTVTSDKSMIDREEKISEQKLNEDFSVKKSQTGLMKTESIQENITTDDKIYTSQGKEQEFNENFDESSLDVVPEKLTCKKEKKRVTEDDFSIEEDAEKKFNETEDEWVVDLNMLVFKRESKQLVYLKDYLLFFKQVKLHEAVKAPKKPLDAKQQELKKIEDDIYLHFMNKRVRGSAKKSSSQKIKVLRLDLLTQITQASYLHYSWGQVLGQRKEDLLICGRLSSAHLVSNLDYFLEEVRTIATLPSFFSKKVSCSTDMLRRLEGYILMDQYMQKLSTLPTT